MNTRKILTLKNKMKKEAQLAVNKVYRSYDKELNELIASELPKGHTLVSGNGQIMLIDASGKKLDDYDFKKYISEGHEINLTDLQYGDKIFGHRGIKTEIKAKRLL